MSNNNSPTATAPPGEQDRATGRTTRQVDAYVQELLRANMPIALLDHWEAGTVKQANTGLLSRVQQRMRQEFSKELTISWYGVVPFVSIKK